MTRKKLIVGLGNPGKKYKNTRHNAGFMAVDLLSSEFKKEKKCNTLLASEERYTAAKPRTFMNKSGKAIKCLLKKNSFRKEDLLVVVDDFNLSFGKIRYRPSGSSGGHNGLQSVIDYLDSEEFHRLRIGIGKGKGEDKVRYVLSRFNKRELKDLEDILIDVKKSILYYIDYGIQETMNKFN